MSEENGGETRSEATGGRTSNERASRQSVRYWIGTGACAWAVLFAAPHAWWALGVPAGFPGGEPSYREFMASPWLRLYNLAVIGLCLASVILTKKVLGPADEGKGRPFMHLALWIASVALLVRAGAGLVADGASDPIWWPTFLVGGLLFGAVAGMAQAPRRSRPTSSRDGFDT
jgi:hypothetical protein